MTRSLGFSGSSAGSRTASAASSSPIGREQAGLDVAGQRVVRLELQRLVGERPGLLVVAAGEVLVGHPRVQVGVVGLLLELPLELRELDRLLLADAGPDRLDHLVEEGQVPRLEVGLLDVEAVGDGAVGRQAAAVGVEHLDQGVGAEPLEHVLGVELRLAVGHLAVFGLLGADEAEVDRVEVEELRRVGTRSRSILFHSCGRGKPSLSTARASVYQCGMLNSVCWRVMTWTSSCLSTRAQLNGLLRGAGAGQRDDLAGAGADGRDERQADRPAAEPLVVLHDLDLGQARRGVAEPRGQLAVDRFEVPRHVLAQELRPAWGRPGRCSARTSIGRVGVHVLEHLHHVVGADVERVGVEGGVEEVAGLGLAADLHVEHAQADRGVGAGRVGGGGEQEGALGGVVLAAVGQPLAQRGVEGGRAGGCSPGPPPRRRPRRPGRPASRHEAASRARASSSRGFSATAFRAAASASANRSSEMFRSARRTYAGA